MNMSNQRVAFIAACLAITVALGFFLSAVWSGAPSHDTQSDIDYRETAPVRYVMNYAVDSDLYSFYGAAGADDVALSDASETP